MHTKKISYSKSIVLILCLFLILVNGSLGTILIIQSKNSLKQQMSERMLDILASAAALLDGDVLASLEKEDFDTPQYQESLKILRSFQENFNLNYIYGVRDEGNKSFSFTIDPDPENPGDFGEPIIYTDALYQASLGFPSVDKDPYEDRWGRFYSAYYPVFGANGNVGGIIAVDVEALWYEKQIREYIITTVIIVAISLIVGGLIVFVITQNLQKRLLVLNSEMKQLTNEVDELARELRLASRRNDEDKALHKKKEHHNGVGNGLEELSDRLNFVRKELRLYIEDAHDMAYTDVLTGCGNRNAYFDILKKIDEKIAGDSADFAIAVFDINGLKGANDTFGHEYGDLLITTAADILKNAAGSENLFRIGGDEFVAVIENSTNESMSQVFETVDTLLTEKNLSVRDFREKAELAISKGFSIYNRVQDSEVSAVFRRADDAMYRNKAEYYRTHDRRRR